MIFFLARRSRWRRSWRNNSLCDWLLFRNLVFYRFCFCWSSWSCSNSCTGFWWKKQIWKYRFSFIFWRRNCLALRKAYRARLSIISIILYIYTLFDVYLSSWANHTASIRNIIGLSASNAFVLIVWIEGLTIFEKSVRNHWK